eukprot:CAMPEP_0115016868 /NCGR_PEP_ID=MMETSP0216-20121206/27732_1 /TAXON_ID=223996 /ORGANISM="Protocruzia adherens, Strain Boccale" /LENGTH=445 /DNA_ID=CAMNT_0002387485 /DNA_START=274 /DNA_END=1611 /DNA_ORIENTATION=+
MLDEKLEEFHKLTSHMDTVFKSHEQYRDGLNGIVAVQSDLIVQHSMAMIAAIVNKTQEMKETLVEKAEVYATNSGVMTEKRYLEWENLRSQLEQDNFADFISKTLSDQYQANWLKTSSQYKPASFSASKLRHSLEAHPLGFELDDICPSKPILSHETIKSLLPFKSQEPLQFLPSIINCAQVQTDQIKTYNMIDGTTSNHTFINSSFHNLVVPSVTFHKDTYYFSGGYTRPAGSSSSQCLTSVASFCNGKWQQLPPLPKAICQHAFIASPDGAYLYIIGGADGTQILNSCYRYALDQHQQWQPYSQLPVSIYCNGGFFYCRDDDVSQYCIGTIGDATRNVKDLLICNVCMEDSGFFKGVWERIGLYGGRWPSGITQVGQVSSKEAIVVTNNGQVYSLAMAKKEFHLTQLTTLRCSLEYKCGFGYYDGKVGILGDRGEYCEVQLHK